MQEMGFTVYKMRIKYAACRICNWQQHADHRERVQHALTKQKMQCSFCSGSYIACRSIQGFSILKQFLIIRIRYSAYRSRCLACRSGYWECRSRCLACRVDIQHAQVGVQHAYCLYYDILSCLCILCIPPHDASMQVIYL